MTIARPRAVVTGMIVSYPLGGVVFDYGQYLVGLEALGFDVYYLEDTGWQVFDPVTGCYGEDYDYGLAYLQRALAFLSPTLADRWAVRRMDGELIGPAAANFDQVLRDADLFLNVSGGTVLREPYRQCRVRALIDTDPGFNQMQNYPKQDAFAALERSDRDAAERLLLEAGLSHLARDMDGWFAASDAWRGAGTFRDYHHHFSYAERIGAPDCTIPTLGITWQPTRPPVAMELWAGPEAGPRWTTVLSWRTIAEPIVHAGRAYGGKESEFRRIETLPSRTAAPLEVAAGGDEAPRAHWRNLGWTVKDAVAVSATPEDYRDYILGSRGEFGVAKNIYVDTRSGWFSCRSVCYLAAGLPVVVQDTGFSDFIPVGRGLFGFSDAASAAVALEAAEADYEGHRQAARALARSYFSTGAVLGDLLRRTGIA